MKKEKKIICNLIYSFIEENFDKIEYDLTASNLPSKKDKFLKHLKNNFQDCMWALTELASWGMDKAYFRELYPDLVDSYEFPILLIDGKYLKYWLDDDNTYHIKFVEPKIKEVIYFE